MITTALARGEWRRLWVRPFAWCLAAAVCAGMTWQLLGMLDSYLQQQDQLAAAGSSIGYTDLVVMPWLALFVIALGLMAPLVTMAMLAGDRRNGTLGALLASGLSPLSIVLGKYVAASGWLLVMLLIPVAVVLTLALHGSPDWGKLLAGLLGLVLLALTLAAIGLACSACTPHPALAAALALGISAALMLVGNAAAGSGPLHGVLDWLSLPAHLHPMQRGVVDSADIAWFVIVSVLALALATHRVARQRQGN